MNLSRIDVWATTTAVVCALLVAFAVWVEVAGPTRCVERQTLTMAGAVLWESRAIRRGIHPVGYSNVQGHPLGNPSHLEVVRVLPLSACGQTVERP